MGAIAEFKRYGARDGDAGWNVAMESRVALSSGSGRVEPTQAVVESCAEQPWAEFCGALDKPAFLLPVTGFGEL